MEIYSLSLKIAQWEEKNYEIYDKKMLVVIRGLENWRYPLEAQNSSSKSRQIIRT